MPNAKNVIEKLVVLADVELNGPHPWDPQVHNDALYARVLKAGTLGLGEAYMDGWWDCEQLDGFVCRVLRADLDNKLRRNWRLLLQVALATLFNRQGKSRAFQVGKKHYDLGNDLFVCMLDPRLVYTCGYWKDATSLAEAQEAKLDLVCRKIGLKSGQRVLDIGCGWGSFAKFAAEKYGVSVVGVTVSEQQAALARTLCEKLPIEIRLQSYTDLEGTFDHVVSLGMFEHVGYKNYATFFNVVHRALKDGGLFLLHTIGSNVSGHTIDPWVDRYIFPNAMLPSIRQIGSAIEGAFVMEDWHNFSLDYDRTLQAWYANFNQGWDKIASHYSKRFYRMWTYFLLGAAGTFRSRDYQLWQVVLSKDGVRGGYSSLR